uniref:Trafficking protein, kinesin binding 2 n=1 Tax=Sinocyclocheilus grahami TaxID=75366 RepID=A0A672MV29_SINGR
MTKTYSAIDVVTHLLAERDRDLELAARIGQSLLQRNHVLQERNESLEEQLAQAIDQVHQLQHELAKKDELLRMVASTSEESETDSSCSTPLRHPAGAALALSQLEALQSKLLELEEENLSLRSEACHLKTETITYEEKEQQLVNDCVKELRESNSQMVSLADELSQKNEELMRHQEEITHLLSQIVELQQRVKELALEKEELRIHLQASKEAQRQLTAEVQYILQLKQLCVCKSGLRLIIPIKTLLPPIPGSARSGVVMTPVPYQSHTPNTEERGHHVDTTKENSRLGQPGSLGGNDLTSALNCLSLRRQNFLCERQFFQVERERKLQELAAAESEGGGSSCSSPMGSTVSSFTNLSEFSISSSCFKTFLPEKLQIVKPMEGE